MKVFVQFDGSNFYRKIKAIIPGAHLTTFDYAGLATMIAEGRADNITYYVGEIRQYNDQPKSKALFVGQQRLFHLLKAAGITIKLGYLLLSDGRFHEKGVDVQIVVDMVKGAIKGTFDVVYLISSDAGLLPAIETAKDEGKRVIYVGFAGFVSRALMKNCSSSIVLTAAHLKPFLKA